MSPSDFTPTTGIDKLTGKVILVTGGNSGLGKETILQLAKHEPSKIFMAARSEEKALAAISEIKSQLQNPVEIEYLPLDTSSFPSVAAAAERFKTRSSRLDILILNAGIMATPPGTSSSGHDLQLATNHLGHHLLTKLLLPTLTSTAASTNPSTDVRVITISSEAYQMAPSLTTITNTPALNASSPWARYGASKAANILFAAELGRRVPSIASVAVHPGMIKTDLWKHDSESHSFMGYFMAIFGTFLYKDVEHGAWNQLWASGAKKDELKGAAYYTPVGKGKPGNKFAKDQEAGKMFWEWTEAQLKKEGFELFGFGELMLFGWDYRMDLRLQKERKQAVENQFAK